MLRSAAVIVASVVALVVVLSAPAGPPANPTLIATVGTNDGFDIGLADANGVPVTRIPPGTYDFVVRDRSTAHNFHLASNEDPTVNFRTELDFVGEMTFTATLKDDTRYAYACEPHWQTMNGEFFITSRPVTPPPPKPVVPPTVRAGVTANGKAFVSARSLRAGRYRLVDPGSIEPRELPFRRTRRESAHRDALPRHEGLDCAPHPRAVPLRKRSGAARSAASGSASRR